MSKFITTCAVIAIVLAGLAILEPPLYNSLLNAITHFVTWLNR